MDKEASVWRFCFPKYWIFGLCNAKTVPKRQVYSSKWGNFSTNLLRAKLS
jgi:hypothetical protein